jgi:cellulose synthase/poly-beta-1,6-N-acetylglucosamine synthase-like glycosyltransferase
VDDGSTDQTRAVAERARALGLVDMVICHGTRCGRSPAINAAARFASGDLILTVDADTVFEPTAVARVAAAFSDQRVGGGRLVTLQSATRVTLCGPVYKLSNI